jgi:hypothetical protein
MTVRSSEGVPQVSASVAECCASSIVALGWHSLSLTSRPNAVPVTENPPRSNLLRRPSTHSSSVIGESFAQLAHP